MHFKGEGIMKNLFVVICLTCAMILSGCAAAVNMSVYDSNPPKRIGVVIGHEMQAVADLTHGQIILYSIVGGAAGIAAGAAMAENNSGRLNLDFEKGITNIIWEKIQKDVQGKNYAVQLIDIKPKEYKLLENVSDTDAVYPRLVKYYQLEEKAKTYDAILFVEVLIEGRLTGDDKIEKVNMENMKMKYAKSKLFLYDVMSGKRIYHDSIQRGYSAFSNTKLLEALDTIIVLGPVPAARVQ